MCLRWPLTMNFLLFGSVGFATYSSNIKHYILAHLLSATFASDRFFSSSHFLANQTVHIVNGFGGNVRKSLSSKLHFWNSLGGKDSIQTFLQKSLI